MKKIQRHRRHFQLLELMVAVFILLVCIAPIMRMFTSMYLSEREIVRENQRDHLAHMAHAKITEQLYKRQISLEDVNNPISLNDLELNEGLKKFSYSCEGILTIVKSSTPDGQERPTMYLGQLVIKMTDLLASKKQDQRKEKKIENQDPAETFYDYFVYIDAGDRDQNKGNKKASRQAISSDNRSEQNSLNTGAFKGAKKLKEAPK